MLIDDMFVGNGDEVLIESLLQPRVVAEIAFVMADDLAGPGVTTADALTAVGGVLPVIEIVDSRIADWRVELLDTVADNASSGKVVLEAQSRRPPPSTCAWPGSSSVPQRSTRRKWGGCGRTGQSGPKPHLAGQQAAAARQRR